MSSTGDSTRGLATLDFWTVRGRRWQKVSRQNFKRSPYDKPKTLGVTLVALPAIAAVVVVVLYLLLLGWGMLMRSTSALSDWTRRLTKRGNPYLRMVAGTRAGMIYFNLSALHHAGRRTGRTYVTPLSAYPLGDGFVLAAAYPHVDWLENVLAAGECALRWNGSEYALERPELISRGEAMTAYPALVRPFLAARPDRTSSCGCIALRHAEDPELPTHKEIHAMDDTTSRIGVMATEALDLLIDAVDQIPPDELGPAV